MPVGGSDSVTSPGASAGNFLLMTLNGLEQDQGISLLPLYFSAPLSSPNKKKKQEAGRRKHVHAGILMECFVPQSRCCVLTINVSITWETLQREHGL
jgi:hypothetical protein